MAKAQATTQAQATSHDNGGDVKYLGLQKGNSDEDKDYTTASRSLAMQKRNKQQVASAEKKMRRCGAAAICNGAEPGTVVTLKVDYRTHSHA